MESKQVFLEESHAKDKPGKRHEKIIWHNKYEFVFNVVGYNVGLGNIWRFSYLCYKDGGGAFLIPYLLVAAFCGIPLLFVEVALGQFTRRGCIAAWDILPLMSGIGFSAMLLSMYFLVYIGLANGWCLIYLVRSFDIPWANCDNHWNSKECVPVVNLTSKQHVNTTQAASGKLSTEEFWDGYVLQKTDSITDMGGFSNWHMLGCFVVGWLAIYLCVVRGIRTSGKVAYLTVIVPYVFMIALFIRGVTLQGAGIGVLYYITPNITKLAEPEVWLDAGSQVIFSLGVCFGCIVSLGSYNKRTFDCYKSAYFFVAVCCGSSLFFGFVVFSFLGHLAHEQNKNVSDVVEGGPGLVFQVIPAELANLPFPQLWSVMFFISLFGLAIDGSYGILEGCITAMADYYPNYFSHKGTHYWRALSVIALMAVGLPQLLDGGIYIFEILNLYGASGICILWLAFFETVAVAWLYGIDEFSDNVKSMIGYRPPKLLMYILKYITPSVSMAIFVACCIEYAPLKLGNYVYPWWANFIGWIISFSVVACIPFFAIKKLVNSEGSLVERWKTAIAPISSQPPDENIEMRKIDL